MKEESERELKGKTQIGHCKRKSGKQWKEWERRMGKIYYGAKLGGNTQCTTRKKFWVGAPKGGNAGWACREGGNVGSARNKGKHSNGRFWRKTLGVWAARKGSGRRKQQGKTQGGSAERDDALCKCCEEA